MTKTNQFRSITFILFLGIICSFHIAAQKNGADKFAFSQNEKLGRGVNIIGYDPYWKTPEKARMQEKHFKLIKDAGFSNVRIVIMPFRFSLKDSAFTIDSVFFKRLDWVVKQALKNKLMAIVDFHEHNAMGKDPLGNKAKFLSIWRQIAQHCKNYPKEVLFEICNEPNMKPEIWNELNITAHAIIRESNPKRTIIWGPIYGNQIMYLKDLKMPENDRNIIVAIHYYSPIQFTHQGAPWSVKNKDLSGIEWSGSDSEMNAVKSDFDVAQEWSKKYNRPITVGEFGAYDRADMASRVCWTNYVARQAESRGWSWSYWQLDSDFILFDMDNNQWIRPILDALIPHRKK